MIIENIIVASICIAAAFITAFVPLIIGAVKKVRVIKPVEYVPPRGASPLDFLVQYYGSSAEPREIFNPLMLYWAERGFITIEEDCKRGLKLTKKKDLQRPQELDGFRAGTFELEQELFDFLFGGSKKVFYTLSAPKTFKEFYEKLTKACTKQAKKINSIKSKSFKIASLVTSFMMLAAVIAIVGLSTQDTLVITCIFPFVAIAFPKAILAIPADGPNDYDGIPKGSAARFLLIPFFTMFGGVPFAFVVASVPVSAAILLTAAFAVCLIIVFFISDKIDIRDDEQLKYYARICGFKHFLLLAEVQQLEMMVEEDPNYYYNILPYCYILKITQKLKPKFDRIALDGPAWYLGELRDTLMF